jgi:hypothetical protein
LQNIVKLGFGLCTIASAKMSIGIIAGELKFREVQLTSAIVPSLSTRLSGFFEPLIGMFSWKIALSAAMGSIP